MFNAAELNLNFTKELSSEAQLVIIPVNKEYGVIAVVKPLGSGKAACVAFSPATKLDNPFQGFRPTFLRKMVTTDFPLREGRWKSISIDKPNALSLRAAVTVLLKDFENLTPGSIKEIDMCRTANASSSPEVSAMTFSTPNSVPFEKALAHLVGLEFTMARVIAKQQAALHTQVAASEKSSESTVELSPAHTSAIAQSEGAEANLNREESTEAQAIRTEESTKN